jgi:hypothetical protein
MAIFMSLLRSPTKLVVGQVDMISFKGIKSASVSEASLMEPASLD